MKKSQLDLVRMVCDLPYLTEKRAKNMEFNVLYIALERQTVMQEKQLQEKQKQLRVCHLLQDQQF